MEEPCLKCGEPHHQNSMWHFDGEVGFLCRKCALRTKHQLLESYDAIFEKHGMPSVYVFLNRIGPKPFPRIGNMKGVRYVVCCIPLRPGKSWSVGTFENQKLANDFCGFWGTHIYTEVHVVEIGPGVDDMAEALTNFERMLNRPIIKPKILPTRYERRSQIGGGGDYKMSQARTAMDLRNIRRG